jgi:hypothetical protein
MPDPAGREPAVKYRMGPVIGNCPDIQKEPHMFEPRNIEPGERLTGKQKVVVAAMNLLLLSELTWAMYLGQQQTEDLTAVFLRTFIPLALVTIVGAKFLLRKFRPAHSKEQVAAQCQE